MPTTIFEFVELASGMPTNDRIDCFGVLNPRDLTMIGYKSCKKFYEEWLSWKNPITVNDLVWAQNLLYKDKPPIMGTVIDIRVNEDYPGQTLIISVDDDKVFFCPEVVWAFKKIS